MPSFSNEEKKNTPPSPRSSHESRLIGRLANKTGSRPVATQSGERPRIILPLPNGVEAKKASVIPAPLEKKPLSNPSQDRTSEYYRLLKRQDTILRDLDERYKKARSQADDKTLFYILRMEGEAEAERIAKIRDRVKNAVIDPRGRSRHASELQAQISHREETTPTNQKKDLHELYNETVAVVSDPTIPEGEKRRVKNQFAATLTKLQNEIDQLVEKTPAQKARKANLQRQIAEWSPVDTNFVWPDSRLHDFRNAFRNVERAREDIWRDRTQASVAQFERAVQAIRAELETLKTRSKIATKPTTTAPSPFEVSEDPLDEEISPKTTKEASHDQAPSPLTITQKEDRRFFEEILGKKRANTPPTTNGRQLRFRPFPADQYVDPDKQKLIHKKLKAQAARENEAYLLNLEPEKRPYPHPDLEGVVVSLENELTEEKRKLAAALERTAETDTIKKIREQVQDPTVQPYGLFKSPDELLKGTIDFQRTKLDKLTTQVKERFGITAITSNELPQATFLSRAKDFWTRKIVQPEGYVSREDLFAEYLAQKEKVAELTTRLTSQEIPDSAVIRDQEETIRQIMNTFENPEATHEAKVFAIHLFENLLKEKTQIAQLNSADRKRQQFITENIKNLSRDIQAYRQRLKSLSEQLIVDLERDQALPPPDVRNTYARHHRDQLLQAQRTLLVREWEATAPARLMQEQDRSARLAALQKAHELERVIKTDPEIQSSWWKRPLTEIRIRRSYDRAYDRPAKNWWERFIA